MNLRNWRRRDWDTAIEAAGIGKATPYVLRHTFASNALAAGVGTFELARYMGTSVEMIERTYGHLVEGADDAFRSRLDAFAVERSGVEVASVAESER
jgi:integrase